MNRSELVVIGRLDRPEPDGFYHIRCRQAGAEYIDRITECYLIFDSHRVFFVTIKERKSVSNRTYYSFLEDGIAEEVARTQTTELAIAHTDMADTAWESAAVALFGYQVFYRDTQIGVVENAMVSAMQAVLVIRLEDGRELLVPHVTQFVTRVDKSAQSVFMDNLDSLLDVCTSM